MSDQGHLILLVGPVSLVETCGSGQSETGLRHWRGRRRGAPTRRLCGCLAPIIERSS